MTFHISYFIFIILITLCLGVVLRTRPVSGRERGHVHAGKVSQYLIGTATVSSHVGKAQSGSRVEKS
jgi:hypothetical protein